MGTSEDHGDEAVRERLRAELARIETIDARAALGVTAQADEAQVRAAFRALAKRYHPARFARHERDVIRLANEVFLRLRGAHDELVALANAAGARRAPAATTPRTEAPGDGAHAKSVRSARAKRLAKQLGYVASGSAAAPARAEPAPPPHGATRAHPIDDLLASARADEARADEAFRRALELLDAGGAARAAEARQKLQALAADYPRNPTYRAHFHCARAMERVAEDRLADARAELDRALALAPEFERARALKREISGGRRGLFDKLRRR